MKFVKDENADTTVFVLGNMMVFLFLSVVLLSTHYYFINERIYYYDGEFYFMAIAFFIVGIAPIIGIFVSVLLILYHKIKGLMLKNEGLNHRVDRQSRAPAADRPTLL